MKGVIEITVKFIFEKVPSVNNSGNVANFVKAKREMLNATPLLPYVEGRSIEALILNYNSARDCGNEFKGIIDAVKGICCRDDRFVLDIRIRNIGDGLATESDITELYISDRPILYPYGNAAKEIKADCTVDLRENETPSMERTQEQERELCEKFVSLFPALAARTYLTGNFQGLMGKYREVIGSPYSKLKQNVLEETVRREVRKNFKIVKEVDEFCFRYASGLSAPMKKKKTNFPLILGQCFEATGEKVEETTLQNCINIFYARLLAFRKTYGLEGENYLSEALKSSWKNGNIIKDDAKIIFNEYSRRGYKPTASSEGMERFIEMVVATAVKYPAVPSPAAAVKVEWRNENMAQSPKKAHEDEVLDLEKKDVKEEIHETATEKELFSPEFKEPEFYSDDEWETVEFEEEKNEYPREDVVIKTLSFALLKKLQELMQEGRQNGKYFKI
jgi:hypothetical protein